MNFLVRQVGKTQVGSANSFSGNLVSAKFDNAVTGYSPATLEVQLDEGGVWDSFKDAMDRGIIVKAADNTFEFNPSARPQENGVYLSLKEASEKEKAATAKEKVIVTSPTKPTV